MINNDDKMTGMLASNCKLGLILDSAFGFQRLPIHYC